MGSVDSPTIVYGGVGLNKTVYQKAVAPHLNLSPLVTGNETSIHFYSNDDFTETSGTSGGWHIGNNALSVGSGNFTIGHASTPRFTMSASGTSVFSSTINSSSSTTGALQLTGGIGIAKDIFVGGQITSTITTGTAPLVIASTTNVPNLNASTLSGATFASPGAIGSSTPGSSSFTTLTASGITSITNTTSVGNTINPNTSAGGALNVSGDIVLGATNPRVYFPQNGVAAPTFTNRSAGTKIVLFSDISGTNVDYSIGIELDTLWNSVPQNTGSFFFRWYGGTTNIATLDGIGNMSLRQYTSTVTTGTAPLVVSSTTNVPNLNASSLSGATFASPGAIGGSTPGSGTFTTLTASGVTSITGTANATSNTSGGSLTALGGASVLKDMYVGGTFYNSSDIRLKTDIQEIGGGILDKLLNIRSVTYKPDPETAPYQDSSETLYGLLAQEVQAEFPYLVKGINYLSLDYSRFTVILLEAIKELRREIQELKAKDN